jgi:hypothetical protein
MRALVAVTICAALALGGCAADEPAAEPADPAGTPTPDRSPDASIDPSPTASPTTEPAPSTPSVTATPTGAPLAWQPTGRPVEETVTAGGGWTVVVDQERSLATVDGPRPTTVAGSKRFRIGEVLLDGDWLVVVRTDTLEERPAVATVIDLTTGRARVVDGRSEPPTTTGGTWALQGDTLVHATTGDDGAYCLARRDLAADTAEVAWCTEPRHGFTHARVTPAALAVMAFDDRRPSCRTLGTVADRAFTPLTGVQECKGWEGVVTDAGAVWTVIPREKALDEARVYAATDTGVVDLGPATTDSLTWCAGATYFVRDPQADGEPARLLRWTDAGAFEVVYETTGGGQAFLSAPRCGGDLITVSVFAESGDQQVSAPLG